MKGLVLLELCCALLCLLGVRGGDDVEVERKRCSRSRSFPAARKAYDLNDTFVPLLTGEAFAEYSPKVLSTDPWIVYFEHFLSEEEVAALEQHLFDSKEEEFQGSSAGGAGKHSARYSETAFCTGSCDDHATLQNARNRAASIVGVPPENFDFSQALRYKEGMFYKSHHDNHPTFHYHPPGARIFTYFVYFSDSGLQGGETFFPLLNIKAPAKRGAAVLFANTRDRNPMETDPRTLHESLPVERGLKRGMNMWLYQYNYRDFWAKACTTIELADFLGKSGKAAAEVQPKVEIVSGAKKGTAHVYAADVGHRGYVQSYSPGRYLGAVPPGESREVESADGDVLLIYTSKRGGKLLREYSVTSDALQRLRVGKRPQAQAEEL